MENKKISFGFIKMKKPDKSKTVEKRDYIECLEEKSIKIIGGEPDKGTPPLIIPMKPNNLITADRLKQIAEEVEKFVEEPKLLQEAKNNIEERLDFQNEDLEQMAVRELLQEAKKVRVVDQDRTLPVINKDVRDGEKESTLEDYEAVPIQEFGMAMLRGMGWSPGQEKSKYKEPQLRPKGLGLGADKIVADNQKKSASNRDEELALVNNAFVKVTSGKHCGCFGKVVSLDEDTGRVLIELAVTKESVSLSEFMMQPVPRSEFDKQSRVINSNKYEEYKKNALITSEHSDPRKYDNGASCSSQKSQKDKAKEASSSRRSNEIQSHCKQTVAEKRTSIKDYYKSSNCKNNFDNRSSSSSEDRPQKRRDGKEKYISCESVNSFSEIEVKDRYKENRKCQSSSSESDCSDQKKHKKSKKHRKNITQEKRDIDKKRKGKKKKRDRDRSPNCRKYRNKVKIMK